MLDITLLGTGGMMPLPYRWLTALVARYNGTGIMIDCGEGSQIAMKEAGISAKPIDVMCFTHFHADHISGLPGMLLTMGNAERTAPLMMIGPRGLERVVNSLRVVAPELPFPILFWELNDDNLMYYGPGYRIEAFRVHHNVPCYGYTIHVDRTGKFDAARAMEQNIPLQYWNALQHGETIEAEGKVFTPEMVLGEARKGLKVTYCTDSRPTPGIVEAAKGADLFICEGMYGEQEKLPKAKENKHMLFSEAARLGKDAEVKEMWLTHYSPSLVRAEEFMPKVREICPVAKAGKDGMNLDLCFED